MTAPQTPAPRLWAYLHLIRPANVVTALADVLAGYAVTRLPAEAGLAWLLAATACLYAGGIVLNDVFDRHTDAVERPERPLPSGKISARSAGFLGAALLAAGVAAAAATGPTAALVALSICASVLLYDSWAKHHPFLGPVNMGLCRALNLMLGVAALPGALSESWALGILPLTYIAAVTVVSRGEVHGGGRGVAGMALVLVSAVVAGLGGLALTAESNLWWPLLLVLLLAWRVFPAFWKVFRSPLPGHARTAVRAGVLSLVLVDAVIAATYAGIIYSLAVLLTGLAAAGLARLFAVT